MGGMPRLVLVFFGLIFVNGVCRVMVRRYSGDAGQGRMAGERQRSDWGGAFATCCFNRSVLGYLPEIVL
jgi:hypothetical protein